MTCSHARINRLCRRMGALALALTGGVLFAGPFTSGNLVVYRVGTGAAAPTSAATPVFVDEYTTVAGQIAPVQSLAMPTSVPALTANGTSTSEGMLTLSPNGQYLALGGYNCNVGTASASGATSAVVNRMIARVDGSGNIDVTTSLTDAFSAGNIRSVTTDGSGFWMSGSIEGIRYATLGATTSILLSNTVTNNRCLGIFGGQLYDSSASGTGRLLAVGTGLPTTAGQTMTNLIATLGSPYGFVFFDLNPGVAGLDTFYVADGTAIKKFCYDGSTWTQYGAITLTQAGMGLTGKMNGTTVELYATAGTTVGNQLVGMSDTTGHNGTASGAATVLATAPANTAFRGVAFAPTAPTVISLSVFEARAQADRVELAWHTGSEFEHAGFHVHRGAASQGAFTRLTPGLIPAKGTAQGGAEYAWTDSAVKAGETWFYKLEDVDTHGVSTFHGPVSATVGATSGIFAFTATPPSIFLGGGSWLAWSAIGALTLNGEAVSGTTRWVAPKATTGYTLADANGATRIVTIAVRPFAVKDMAGLSRAWGTATGDAKFDPSFDLNGDGKIDDVDADLCLK